MSLAIKQYGLLREARRPRAYSVFFHDPLSLSGVREDLAVGMVANVARGVGETVRNDFDAVPIFRRPLVNATWNAVTRRWTDIVEQGADGFTLTPAEPYREVLYRCRPFWYRMEMSGASAPDRISVSALPLPGYALAPMFQSASRPVYRPAFEMGMGEDGLPHSRAGLVPLRADSAALMAQARLYDGNARLESVKDWFSDMLLLLVEFATWDLNSLMTGNFYDVAVTGKGMEGILGSAGSAGEGTPCVWRGKENPWRNVRSLLCDIFLKNAETEEGRRLMLYHLPDMRYYSGDVNEHCVQVGPYFDDGSFGPFPVHDFAFEKGVFYPTSAKTTERAFRAFQCVQCVSGDDRPIAVSVGGASDQDMLPMLLPASHLSWEAVQRGQPQESRLGGRLILDEEI